LASPGLFLREHTDECVIIDEIQRLPSLYSHLRALIDERRDPARFILLGSASPSIIKGVSESLAGRVFFTELMPFSLLEAEGLASWQAHWLRGGFPNALTMTQCIDLLEGGFLVNRLQPGYANLGKRLVKTPKIYIRDSGLLHHLMRIRDYDSLLGNPVLGASWEGYVIEQIMRATHRKWEYYFYRTQHGAEVDLVLVNPAGTMYCIEIKFSSAPVLSKGFYHSIEDLQPAHKYVIVPAGDSYPKEGGIRVINLHGFLSTVVAVRV